MQIQNPKDIGHVFTYHAPDKDQTRRYGCLREAAKELAFVILRTCPESADRSAAFRKLRECVMVANASIALEKSDG